MLKKISTRYGNLSIRNKLLVGFAFLIILLILVTSANMLISALIADPAHESMNNALQETMLAKEFSFQFEQMRNIESQINATYLTYSYDGVIDLYERHAPHLDSALAILDELESEYATPKYGGASRSAEKIATIGQLRASVKSYQTFIGGLADGMVEHGDASQGIGGTVISPLNQIAEVVDASEAIDYATSYITAFEPGAALMFPGSLEALKESIRAENLPEAQENELLALADSSLAAFHELLALDSRLIEGFLSIDAIGQPVSSAISEYIASVEEDRIESEKKLDDTNLLHARLTMGASILTVICALGIALFVSRSIVRPVTELATVAQRVIDGDYSRRATVQNTDEVGQLAKSFNHMIGAVSEREARLREQTEELRIATNRAKEAARLKSEFLANVSHELRTPLNAIIGYSDMLQMGMSGELNEKQLHKVARLRENGLRLLNLINDILDLTRIEAQRVEIVSKPFGPRALIERLTNQMEILAQENGLAFEVDIAPDLPDRLVGDEKRIEQVVVNLLSNAFKFTPAGKVMLSASANRAEQTWSLKVGDTGIGIPPHARHLIFEEFRQLDGASTRAYKGTGLGLAITRNLVRIMSGQIGVESELGKGSIFTVTLPLVEEMAAVELVEA